MLKSTTVLKRGACRAVFTKLHNGLLPMFDVHQDVLAFDITAITAKFKVLESKFQELCTLNELVVGELLEKTVASQEDTETTLLDDAEGCAEYEEKYQHMKLRVEALSQPPRCLVSIASPAESGERKTKLKLPKFEFRQFNGDVSQWISFWSQFECVHLDETISDEEKFQYLIQATKPGSKARARVESFPPSAANYQKAIAQLKTRFGRDELLIEHYVRELLSLVLFNATGRTKYGLTELSDRLETQLLALESLGVTSEKYASMLYPLVESALPEGVLRDWERYRRDVGHKEDDDTTVTNPDRLMAKLRSFLQREVESEERITHARDTFKNPKDSGATMAPSQPKNNQNRKVATAADLVSLESNPKACFFCDSLEHASEFCMKAREMTHDSRCKLLRSKKVCFRCLDKFHGIRRCEKELNCLICKRKHCTVMCRGPGEKKGEETDSTKSQTQAVEHSYSNINCAPVLMQTLKVQMKGDSPLTARLMIDTGSQHSYVTRRLANLMKYEPIREEKLVHALFGGGTTSAVTHRCYRIRLRNLLNDFSCNFEALDSENICHAVPSVPGGPWLSELKVLNIPITDTDEGPIDILVGSDVAGRLFTGRKHVLSCGLVALETSLGWTIMGRVRQEPSNYMLNVTTLCTLDLSPSEIWRLDVLGINDPADVSTEQEARTEAREHFLKTVKVLEDGRYEVSLPWLSGHKPLPRGYGMALRRLETTERKLRSNGLFQEYQAVFDEWLQEGVIEKVPSENWDCGHYLPHRAILKEGSTTRIRPVFDASAHEVGKPNLNQCLEKGENLIQLIPSVLLRFRLNKLGVISDIRRAFLQVSVSPLDRDYLRFLWRDDLGEFMIFRHKRVVFGVTSSPYLLGAVIDHHLSKCEQKAETGEAPYEISVIEKLRHSLYVDNCVTSINSPDEMTTFISQARQIFEEARFDLRGWEWSDSSLVNSTKTLVLGLLWDRKFDVLRLNPPDFRDFDEKQVTRRTVQSASQKVFDPLGLFSPTSVIPRLIIQESWLDGGTWDSPLKEEGKKRFLQWMAEVTALNDIEIPRWVRAPGALMGIALHTFCDASQKAFAAVSFLRVETEDGVFVTLIAAKSRVAPLKRVTIPRLELLAATIGARLANSILNEIGPIDCFFWSDSTTALSWIRREEPWGVFVFNRVREIRKLTKLEDWRHVPGLQNPADLASRGCDPVALLESRWWEGPDWLRHPPSDWPSSESAANEEEVLEERRRTAVANVNCPVSMASAPFNKFSSYSRVVNVAAWVLRFLMNKYSKKEHVQGKLTVPEIERAERFILRLVQDESFDGLRDRSLKKLKPQTDKYGLVRLRTKIWARKDSEDFRAPIILPANHEVAFKLIMEVHRRNGHVVGQNLLNLLRERYWILKGRQTVKGVLSKCAVCQRYRAKSLEAETPPLPEARVRDANVFEVIGTDLAGPLYLANGDKVWICLFTCAVYRAVHFEVVSSQSTEAFMLAFRRFVALRGRPSIVYSDNGCNFRGTSNALRDVDWEQVAAAGAVDRIEWRFNPPKAAWWGGFWERMVGVLKVLLRKILGRASLNHEELSTLVYECATYANRRPITYLSEDPEDPVPITPHMFLQEIASNAVPDLDAVDARTLKRKFLRRLRMKEELHNRFRSEYLGQLHLATGGFKDTRSPIVGEVVLIGSKEEKRLDWPMGIVQELIIGHDGKCRAVKLRTANGHRTRTIQHIFPLEICPDDTVMQPAPINRHQELRLESSYPEDSAVEDPDVVQGSSGNSVVDVEEASQESTQKSPMKSGEPKRKKRKSVQKCVVKECETRCGRKIKLPVRFAT